MGKNTWKKIAAGAMSLTIIAGQAALPVNIGGFLTGGKGIEAHAADPDKLQTAVTPNNDAGTIQRDGTTYTAVPAAGYHFDHWIITGYFYPENKPLITTENPYTFRSNNYNYYTITAVFANVADLSTANVTADGSTFTGSPLEPTIKIGDTTLTNGTDYTYTVTDSNSNTVDSVVDAGTYHVKVTAVDGSDYTGEKTVDWVVNPFNLSTAGTGSASHPYTGRGFDMRLVLGNVIFPTADYQYTTTKDGETVSQIKDAGVYNITYTGTGTGNLIGELKTTFTVNKIDPTADLFNFTAPENLYSNGTAKTATIEPATGVSGMGEITQVLYTKDGVAGSETETPTDAGTYKAYVFTSEGVNYNSGTALTSDDWTFTIREANVLVTVPEDVVIADQTAEEGVYSLQCGKTYTIYSNESLLPNDSTGLDISTSTNKQYEGETYNYKYTVAFANTIADGTEYEFAHKHAAKAFSIDADHTDTDKVWVYCEGEPSEDAGCVAYLDTDGAYYYGDAPTIADVKLSDYFDATADVTDFYFTKKGDVSGTKVSPENMEIGTTYIVNATIAVTIDNKVSNFAITREIVFAARPLTMCDAYLVEGENETKLDIVDGVITVPDDKFTYTGEEQAPVIVIKNNILGTETALTEADYTDSIEAKTNAGDYTAELTAVTGEGAKYTGELTVNWAIQKATAEVTAEALDNIVYDGMVLDKTDFNFTDEQGVLESEGAKISITGTDITNAGRHVATITITSDNYNDIVLDVDVTIAQRPVTLTPDAEQKMTFGETEIPDIKYTVEKQNDETKTGFIATDAENASEFFGSVVKLGKEIETTNVLKPELDNDFDYGEFKNDAGTYSFIIDETAGQTTTAGYDNYIPVVAKDAYFTVVPKNIASEDVVVTLEGTSNDFTYEQNKPVVTYDGKTKKVTVESVTDGNTLLVNNADYNIGGTLQKVYPGEFNVQISGQGNYTGITYAGWTVKGMDGAASIATVNNGIKTYDGEDVSGMFTVDLGNIPKSKATVTTEFYKGETKLDAAPVDAGTYTVKVKITAKGYTTQNLEADLVIEKAEVTVTGTLDKNDIIYSDTAPQVISYAFDGVLDAERADFEENTTVDWTLDEETNQYNGVVNTTDEYNNNYSFTVEPVGYAVAPKDIESTDIRVTYTSKAKLNESDWTICDDIVVTDTKTGKILAEGTDYTVNGNTSKEIGTFTIEIIGIGNYTGIKELPWGVVETEEEAATARIAAYQTYDDERRINFTVTNTYNGDKDVTYGYLLYRGSITDMTIEDAAANSDIFNVTYDFQTAAFRAKDLGSGVSVRPYIIVGGTVSYGDQVYVEYDKLKEQEAIQAAHSEIISNSKADNEGRIRFSANFTYTGEQDATYGILIYRSDATGVELTVDNAENNQVCGFETTSFTAKDNGNGVTLRTYILIDGEYIYGAQRTYLYTDFV